MSKFFSGITAVAFAGLLGISGCQQEAGTASTGSSAAADPGSPAPGTTASSPLPPGTSVEATPAAGTRATATTATPASSSTTSDRSDANLPKPDLNPGDAAPQISISKWVQGKPVEKFEGGQIYVVEFWATWCGPCLQAMPHMSELQQHYGDKVQFIGISNEDDETVGTFMERKSHLGKVWSEVLSYRIALDRNDATNTSYMQAAMQNGIPCAFIVGRTGNVEWVGHPMTIDEPLQAVVDGTWDTAAARAEFIEENALELMQQQINMAAQEGDFKKALGLCDEVDRLFSGNEEPLTFMRIQLHAMSGDTAALQKFSTETVEKNFEKVEILNAVAYALANSSELPESVKALAVKAARQASKLSDDKDPNVLDTLATALHASGDLTGAVEAMEKAVAGAPGYAMFEQKLDNYKADAAKAADGK
ncbi:MAG: redoxin domain-containing protein [Planctomycetaceae bacterium]